MKVLFFDCYIWFCLLFYGGMRNLASFYREVCKRKEDVSGRRVLFLVCLK